MSPQVLILVALEPDALCACRILTALFKRDYIGHKIQPICGYDDLTRAGETLVSKMKTQNGGQGGVVVCLGVGGLVDISSVLGLEEESDGSDASGSVEIWLIDARRPWNLGNVFGGDPKIIPGTTNGSIAARADQVERGKIKSSYKPGEGGVIAWDDGDIDLDLTAEREAYCALLEMGDIDEDYVSDESDSEDEREQTELMKSNTANGRKRKSWPDGEDAADDQDDRPRQRRRNGSADSLFSDRSEALATDTEDGAVSRRGASPVVQVTSSAPNEQETQRMLRRRFHRERKRHNEVLHKYYGSGASYSDPIASIMYSLASELGREDNNLLWHAIVGVSSLELYGRSMTGVGVSTALDAGGSAGWGGTRGEALRQELRDEVRRLNPQDDGDARREAMRGEATGTIPTNARSPTDHAIRVSPEPRFLLIRHWSLYDSMLHSPYLGSRLHIWNEHGRKRLHKLLAKMGVSLNQCRQSYTHMDMELKKSLRQRLLTYAPVYGLDGLVPPIGPSGDGWGFVKCWGWKGCFSAMDVAVIVGAILEVGRHGYANANGTQESSNRHGDAQNTSATDVVGALEAQEWIDRFWEAYDALENVDALKQSLDTAQHLHRAILRTGTTVIEKRQIRHLKAFRIAVVKEGPDIGLFSHPAALTKLALWVGEAIAEQERDQRGEVGKGGKPTPLVMASLHEPRGVYVVVGTGGGGGVVDFAARARRKTRLEEKAQKKEEKKKEKERQRLEKQAQKRQAKEQGLEDEESEEEEEDDDDDDDDDESDESDEEESDDLGYGRNRFGNAFQEVVDETNARVRIDSFESCVVEVKKEDLSQFLESLSMKVVVG